MRRPDPRIEVRIWSALGAARTVLNVGAGAGSYEPPDRRVVPVEPSATMRAQRPPRLMPAISAYAEALPLADKSVDAAMATITTHQWTSLERGVAELRRVSRGPIVILTFDGAVLAKYWLAKYASEMIAAECRRYATMERLSELLGGATVDAVPIPFDCVDGFVEAFYGRPEAFLEPSVRRAQSSWAFIDPAVEARSIARLRADLESGAWDARYGHLRSQPEFAGSLRLVVST